MPDAFISSLSGCSVPINEALTHLLQCTFESFWAGNMSLCSQVNIEMPQFESLRGHSELTLILLQDRNFPDYGMPDAHSSAHFSGCSVPINEALTHLLQCTFEPFWAGNMSLCSQVNVQYQ
ncbi:hypothetical protein CEXT_523461 [Caerostris extrusa]|uniref:Uncharacterized protein n=1 Tax=Caerostris extrusa TaxID=172846 RepID=A0AAV4N6K2_CAEEX|nr:hypothetical protein CEXT_523461 [Caerostris extrusa]